jgi:Glycosyl hydrolase family 12
MPPAPAIRTHHGGMTARRPTPALLLAVAILAAVLSACSGGGTTTLCHSQAHPVSGGTYTIMNNEWHSDADQCITTDGTASFTVANSSIANTTHGAPGGYPLIYRGCHWGACTPDSGLPIRVSSIRAGTVITSWRTTQPGGSSHYNVAYDIWFNRTPTTGGQPDGAELMVWLNRHGPLRPAGPRVADDVSIDGRSYHLFLRQRRWNTISYVMTTGATSVRHLDLWPLVAYAVSRGYIQDSWYLISVEAGFELWRGGAGLATNSFSVRVAGGGSP